jgi:hypothetical protein
MNTGVVGRDRALAAGGAFLSGHPRTELTAGAQRTIVIHDVVPITAATVTVIVTGELSDGVAGPAARTRFPAPKRTPAKGKGKSTS